MAITLTELIDSRETTDSTVRMHYILSGTDSDTDAESTLLSTVSTTYNGKIRGSYTIGPISPDTESGTGMWDCTVEYDDPSGASLEEMDESDVSELDDGFSFSTMGGSRHITSSIKTISKTKAGGGTAPDMKGSINVEKSGGKVSVRGLDVTIPVLRFSVTKHWGISSITSAYIDTLYQLTGTVNSASATINGKSYDAGTLLFLGASGELRGEIIPITYSFAASPNQTSIAIPDDGSPALTIPAKKGWEYLWLSYETDVDNGDLVKTPSAGYVEQVYPTAAFSGLSL